MGKKYVDEPELWKKTEDMVRDVLKSSGINFVEVANEAAFYGPKIDVQVWSAIGREFTIATNQVDFAVPKRFGLVYKDRDNTEKTPLCIHRAPLGTHERFIGFLIEHYAGNFPLWLAPEQVRVLTIGDEAPLVDYAQGHRQRTPRQHGPRRRRLQQRQYQRQDRATPRKRKSTPCSSLAVATWKPAPSACVSTAKATSAPSRRATSWRTFCSRSKNAGRNLTARDVEHGPVTARTL